MVIAGGGLVAATVVRELRALGFGGELTIVSDEPWLPYNRPPLSKEFLAGGIPASEIALLARDDLEHLGVSIVLDRAATGLDPSAKVLRLDDGHEIAYGSLVIATGARPRRLADVDSGLVGVHYLRSLSDATALAADLVGARSMAIVGAGFIGLEVAATARDRGIAVTVVEAERFPLRRVLNPEAAELITALHRDRGVQFRCSTRVLDVETDRQRRRLWLSDGAALTVDVIVIGIGAIPNTEWLNGSRLDVEDGVLCDARGQTTMRDVYAAGDVARWHHAAFGAPTRMEQWTSAVEQAAVLADAITGGTRHWDAIPYLWSDQYDQKIQFCGISGPLTQIIRYQRGTVAWVGNETTITGILAISSPRMFARGRALLARGAGWDEATALATSAVAQ